MDAKPLKITPSSIAGFDRVQANRDIPPYKVENCAWLLVGWKNGHPDDMNN